MKKLIGKKHSKLTVIEEYKNGKMLKCKCECGNEVILDRNSFYKSRNCGCIKRDIVVHHGLSCHKLYKVRNTMIARCYNPKNCSYKNYGERGIKVCKDWLDKEIGIINFYNWAISNGYVDGLTIDRINIDGDYEPSNCRWTTVKQQANNRRSNHLITFKGKTQNLQEWSKELGISRSTLKDRLSKNLELEEVFKTSKLSRWRNKK